MKVVWAGRAERFGWRVWLLAEGDDGFKHAARCSDARHGETPTHFPLASVHRQFHFLTSTSFVRRAQNDTAAVARTSTNLWYPTELRLFVVGFFGFFLNK